jgi:hypothetical protein
MKTTDNFNLNKPESTDFYDVDNFNDNMDIIDEELEKRPTSDGNASNMTTEFTEVSEVETLTSGEKLGIAFGKIAKAVSTLIKHISTSASTSVSGHVKLSDSTAVTDSTGLALPATEKNASIEGTLAHQIAELNTDLSKKLTNEWTTILTVDGNGINTIDLSGYTDLHVLISYGDSTLNRCLTIDLTQTDLQTDNRTFYAGAILGNGSYFSAKVRASKTAISLNDVVLNGTSYASSAKMVVRAK